MKKVLVTLAILVALGFSAQAQYFSNQNDGYFTKWDDVSNGLDKSGELPGIPGGHGGGGDVPVPLGTGL